MRNPPVARASSREPRGDRGLEKGDLCPAVPALRGQGATESSPEGHWGAPTSPKQGSGGASFSHSLFFYLSAAFLSPCLSSPGCTTWFPCSNNCCCSDSSPNPALMLMANDRQGKQKLHFRGKVINSVYCLLCPLCRASGISSTDADTCLETHLLSLEPLQY